MPVCSFSLPPAHIDYIAQIINYPILKRQSSQEWEFTLVIPALENLRQQNQRNLEIVLVIYIVSQSYRARLFKKKQKGSAGKGTDPKASPKGPYGRRRELIPALSTDLHMHAEVSIHGIIYSGKGRKHKGRRNITEQKILSLKLKIQRKN